LAQTRPVPGVLYTQGEKETIITDYFNNIIGQKETRSNSFNWDLLNLTCLTNVVVERMDRPFSELKCSRPYNNNLLKRCQDRTVSLVFSIAAAGVSLWVNVECFL
jgi:hypothetical protein